MGSLFQKFQEFVRVLSKNSVFAKDPRKLQFEADVNRLFLYTSYNRLGEDADEKDAEEIIEMASKASVADQQKLVQENIHSQIKTFCTSMDDILCPDFENFQDLPSCSPQPHGAPRPSGLSFAVGGTTISTNRPAVPKTQSLNRAELSVSFKDQIGYTLDLSPSQISSEEAGLGIFLKGKADVGSVIAFYPGVIYSPAYYRNIPGYPRVDAHNPYLISRYDGIVIDAQPWGSGSDSREGWDGVLPPEFEFQPNLLESGGNSDRLWRFLSKPLAGGGEGNGGEVLERRNPLAFGHYANHPAKGTDPNVMVCPYDFPAEEGAMRSYIPNVLFGRDEEARMKRYGNFWFKSGSSGDVGADTPVMRTLVLVATRALCDEEVLLNYRLSNAKRRPAWYHPVDEEEDRRRWS